jgi:hypothetical protein
MFFLPCRFSMPKKNGDLFTGTFKGTAIPVTDDGGPYVCETSRISHFLDSLLTDGCEVASLTRRPPFTSRKIPGIHFC